MGKGPENLSSELGSQHPLPGLGGEFTVVTPPFPCAKGKISEENRNKLVQVGFASLGINPERFEELTPLQQSKLVRKLGSEISKGEKPVPTSDGLLLGPKEAVAVLSGLLHLVDPKLDVRLRVGLGSLDMGFPVST